MNTNFKVIGLTRLGIKPKFTATEADALTTRPSNLFKSAKWRRSVYLGVGVCICYYAIQFLVTEKLLPAIKTLRFFFHTVNLH